MTVTTNKGYPLPVINGNYNVWGILLNQGFGIVDQNLGGNTSVSVAGSSNVALTSTQLENVFITLTGALTGNIQVSVPATSGGFWFIWNNTTGAFTLTMTSQGAGSSFLMTQGNLYVVLTDGTNVYGITNIGAIPNDTFLGNISGSSSNPSALTMTNALDAMIGNTVGAVLIRGAAGWIALPVGVNGQVLQTQGGGAQPIWASLAAIPATGVIADLANTTFVAGDLLYYNGTHMVALAPGTQGQILGQGASNTPAWINTALMSRNPQAGNYTLQSSDQGGIVSFSATATLTTFAAATNFWCVVQNNGAGNVTWAGTVDGIANWIMYPNEVRLVQYDGTNWHSYVMEGGSVTYTSSNSSPGFVMPPGYEGIEADGVGGGAGGGYQQGGGAGGRYQAKLVIPAGTAVAVTIGAGGTAGTNSTNGGYGGNTTLGTYLIWYGGSPGLGGGTPYGGSGGGSTGTGYGGLGGNSGTYNQMNSQTNTYGGGPNLSKYMATYSSNGNYSSGTTGGDGGVPSYPQGGSAEWGGAAGSYTGSTGGSSLYGPGGGAGNSAVGGKSGTYTPGGGGTAGSGATPGGPGTSRSLASGLCGDGGGGGGTTGAGGAGGAPGGGGGGSGSGASNAGAGARGELYIRLI